MDIYCLTCGEPWELDTFHEAAEDLKAIRAVNGTLLTYDEVLAEVRADFTARGCAAFRGTCNPDTIAEMEEAYGADMRRALAAIYDEADNLDDLAMALEDFVG